MNNDKIIKLYNDYTERVNKAFPSLKITTISYGSFAYGVDTSDFDVCNIFDSYNQKDREKIKEITINFHEDNNLKIDGDVPFENKCIFSFKEIEKVIENPPFPFVSGKYCILPVIKNSEYLSSIELKNRLLLNILTSKIVIINGNINDITYFTKKAWETLIRVIFSNNENKPLSQKKFIDYIYKNPYGNEKGKEYLGYCIDKKHILDHFNKECFDIFNELLINKKIKKINNNEFICSDDWLLEIIKNKAQ